MLAGEDLQAATNEGNPNRIRAYHCEQAAEKALKAVLSHLQQTYLKNHDLVDLVLRLDDRTDVSVPVAFVPRHVLGRSCGALATKTS